MLVSIIWSWHTGHDAPLIPSLVKNRIVTSRFFLAITEDTATPCSIEKAFRLWIVWQQPQRRVS
jgi:hypothetical protein